MGGFPFWILVMPIGFLLTMYTSHRATTPPRTPPRRRAAPRSPRPRACGSRSRSRRLIGWFVLLALVFAATHVSDINDRRRRLDPGHHHAR